MILTVRAHYCCTYCCTASSDQGYLYTAVTGAPSGPTYTIHPTAVRGDVAGLFFLRIRRQTMGPAIPPISVAETASVSDVERAATVRIFFYCCNNNYTRIIYSYIHDKLIQCGIVRYGERSSTECGVRCRAFLFCLMLGNYLRIARSAVRFVRTAVLRRCAVLCGAMLLLCCAMRCCCCAGRILVLHFTVPCSCYIIGAVR